MRSTLNLLIVLAILAITLACGVLEDSEGNGTDSSTDAESGRSDNRGGDIFDDGDLSINDENLDPSADDDSRDGEDKSITVRFGKGKTSGAYRDTVYGDTKHTYSFGVSRDQQISVRISSDDEAAYLIVSDPVGKEISLSDDTATSFAESAPASGKYKIEVVTESESSDYTITFAASALPKKEVEDSDPGPGGLTKTVRFAKGRSSATYSDAVIRGERNTYILGAKGGQLMSVNISSLENNAVFQIQGPGGYLRGTEPGSDRTSWSGQLPANGNYRVIVGGTRGNATYTITIAIR